jgi:hypothetical protein
MMSFIIVICWMDDIVQSKPIISTEIKILITLI